MTKRKYKDIMVDLETMSTKTNASIVAIGAVQMDFKSGKTLSEYYRPVDLESSCEIGLHLCPKTVLWWFDQSEEARHAFIHSSIDIRSALNIFTQWLETIGKKEEIRIWGNGATFDNVILRSAFEAARIETPWFHYNDMCFRTEKNMNPQVKKEARPGIHHHALDDAKYQASHLISIIGHGKKEVQ